MCQQLLMLGTYMIILTDDYIEEHLFCFFFITGESWWDCGRCPCPMEWFGMKRV